MLAPVHVIDQRNRYLYAESIEDMWRMRHRVAERYNWSIPYLAEGLDRDAFDTPETVYLLLLTEDGRVYGCSRLNPTDQPHLLDTVFPGYCEAGAIPKSPRVWEFSRMFVDRDYVDLKEVVRSCYLLMSGVAELIHAHGLDGVTWYTSMPNYQAALACWRRTHPIGMPTVHRPDNVIYIPAYSPIDEEGVCLIKERARYEGPVCQYQHARGEWILGTHASLFQRRRRSPAHAA